MRISLFPLLVLQTMLLGAPAMRLEPVQEHLVAPAYVPLMVELLVINDGARALTVGGPIAPVPPLSLDLRRLDTGESIGTWPGTALIPIAPKPPLTLLLTPGAQERIRLVLWNYPPSLFSPGQYRALITYHLGRTALASWFVSPEVAGLQLHSEMEIDLIQPTTHVDRAAAAAYLQRTAVLGGWGDPRYASFPDGDVVYADLLAPRALAARLVTGADPLARRLWRQATDEQRASIEQAPAEENDQSLRLALVALLQAALVQPEPLASLTATEASLSEEAASRLNDAEALRPAALRARAMLSLAWPDALRLPMPFAIALYPDSSYLPHLRMQVALTHTLAQQLEEGLALYRELMAPDQPPAVRAEAAVSAAQTAARLRRSDEARSLLRMAVESGALTLLEATYQDTLVDHLAATANGQQPAPDEQAVE